LVPLFTLIEALSQYGVSPLQVTPEEREVNQGLRMADEL
jgi:hypothetical protein